VKKTDLAAALELSVTMVRRLERRGMPTTDVEAARLWRKRTLDPSRTKQARIDRNPGTALKSNRQWVEAPSSQYLDGLDDGWAAAFEALADFVELYGVAKYGPALFAIVFAMPYEAAGLMRPRPALEDQWDELEKAYDDLIAKGGQC
jgi:hypothetical protein